MAGYTTEVAAQLRDLADLSRNLADVLTGPTGERVPFLAAARLVIEVDHVRSRIHDVLTTMQGRPVAGERR